MDALIARAQTLRCYLQSAAGQCSANGDSGLEQKLAVETNPDVCYALDQTFLVQAKKEAVEALPRAPWSCENCISHTELIHHVIERLLARKRTAVHWEDANILTLGYREVTPGASGHRVTQSNGIMCYYPNTLVSTLKKPLWESLHQLMGDDLMTHLLLNYTIFARVKDMQLSYIQLAGKSLRKDLALITGNTALAHQTPAPGAVSKREISINQVMYARHFQKDRVFASSHTLVKASKTSAAGELISRGEAARVLRSIFTDIAGEKRLPKRLINLIPSVQALVARFKACDVEDLSRKLAPLSPSFRKFMANNPDIKRTIAERKADAEAASQPLILPIVCKALDDGYLSQTEESNSDRKRKRREEAIVVLSHASEVSSTTLLAPPSKKQKNILNNGIKDRNRVCEKPNLANLQEHKEDIKNVLTFTTPKKKVYRLVRKLVARVVPKTVWGDGETKKNWKCVKAMLRKLIFSRKFDIFTLKKCAYEFQVTNVEWMSHQAKATFCPPNEKIKRHRLFEDLLGWVVSTLVFPLLRNLFYITEAEGMANEIAYYQRPVWNVISALALDDLEGGILQPSNEQAVAASHERQLATSRLRLLPKATGVRPLMNLATPVDQASVSVNRSMEPVHRVLTFEMDRQPKRLLGASVRNLDEIYKRLKPLFRNIASCSRCAERRRTSGGGPRVYCVAVDIERCFDTIRPRKLYQVLKKALREDEYLIRKHWVGHQVSSIEASDAAAKPLASFFFKMERPACPSGALLGFDELAAQSKKKNAMFVDGVIYDYLTKAKALQLLKEHLFTNVVQVDGREFIQRCGIPQGSVLSTTLCNIYYAHFERRVLRKHLPEPCDPAIVPPSCCQHEELLRYTDDFFYITTDLKRAQKFVKVMHEGNEEYGCFANLAKSQANFASAGAEAEEKEGGVRRGDTQEPEGCLSWCGMLIDPTNLQIYVNYDKLSGSLVQASIPLNEMKSARSFFVNKVISPIRQRWHALYFDPDFLSEDTIHINLFQMLVVTAHRFTLLIEMLPFVNQDMRFFYECILQILRKATKGIHRSLELARGASTMTCEPNAASNRQSRDQSSVSYQVQKRQVWPIGLYAFQLMIQAKRDQTKSKNPTQLRPQYHGLNWQKLLDAIQNELQRRSRTLQGAVPKLGWLKEDRRNSAILKQCLRFGSS